MVVLSLLQACSGQFYAPVSSYVPCSLLRLHWWAGDSVHSKPCHTNWLMTHHSPNVTL